jgi:FixJ family two-component response regulator
MPGISGRQLAAELRRRYHQIPIVWISGHTREAELQAGRVGSDEPFLNKPVPPEVLLETVKAMIAGLSKARS